MKVEIHILQNFPPANLNRDDTGSPKDCFFGGVRRARISSQCLKRSTRVSDTFKDHLGEGLAAGLADRTKRHIEQIAKELHEAYGFQLLEAQEASKIFIQWLLPAKDGSKKKRNKKLVDEKNETSYLIYIGPDEVREIGSLIQDTVEETRPLIHQVLACREEIQTTEDQGEKKRAEKTIQQADKVLDKIFTKLAKDFIKKHVGHVKAIDVALFGRMLADEPKLNIDASMQVAHAISVNAVQMEFDYYTAVDDLKQQEQETGAGMIGTVAYNSSTFYRYAVADLDQLTRNLGGDRKAALQGIQAFLHAFIHARPSGKQNSFAAHTPPSLVLAVARPNGMPFSLADAFEDPVNPNGQGLVAAAVEKLDGHWGAITSAYPLSEGTIVKVKAVEGKGTLERLAPYQVATVPAVVDDLIAALQSSAEETT